MKLLAMIAVFSALTWTLPAQAKLDAMEVTQKSSEKQIRNLLEPILDKYCRDECKLLSVNVNVDLSAVDDAAPGFDDIDPKRRDALTPSFGRVKLLVDDKVGPVSRGKLMDLLQQYLDTLDYPVKIDTQLAHFPQPIESSGKIAEMRERVLKQFRATMDELFQQFCPEQCLLGDVSLKTEVVNGEELQYGGAGEFQQDGDTAIRIRELSASILTDETLSPEERQNLLEMAKLKTNYLKNVALAGKTLKFPHGLRSGSTLLADGTVVGGSRSLAGSNSKTADSLKSDSKTTQNSSATDNRTVSSTDKQSNNATSTNKETTASNNNNSSSDVKQEKFERIEKIERVESGDAISKELEKFKVYGLIFACSILSLLIFIAIAALKPHVGGARAKLQPGRSPQRVNGVGGPLSDTGGGGDGGANVSERAAGYSKRYEIERLMEELMAIYAQQPKVAKHVFSRVLTEEGVETTSYYIWMLGENIVMDMLRDPSLQSDMTDLMEFYAKNTFELEDNEKLDLLRKLHSRTVASKISLLSSRSSTLFDFLAEMDSVQILELIRNESLTIKAIVLTQCDPQKRATIYSQLDEHIRMTLLTELSRIDYLPRDYIYNVSNALKRKRKENPKLNTEALPGSEVLVNLLERTSTDLQRSVVRNLEAQSPDSARAVKAKLVCLDTLRFLRDGQLLEVILSLRHDELLTFLKGAPEPVRQAIFAKSPRELISELEEELTSLGTINREAYAAVERKMLNRLKTMANEGIINLVETNERMFADNREASGFIAAAAPEGKAAA